MTDGRRVLVTGGTGFIGRTTLGGLVGRGYDVHAAARTPPEPVEGVTWHAGDLLDDPGGIVAQVAPSHLLHLAWYAEPGAFWRAPENGSWVAATIRLVQAFAEAGGRRAVMAGTCAEYDWVAPEADSPLREDAPLGPSTLYGVCKDATRRVCGSLVPELAWGRVFFLYGPGEDERRLVAGVAQGLARGERVPTTAGTQRRDFMHVADVGAAFTALLDSELTGPVNVASGQGVSVRAIAEALADAAGSPELLDVGALEQRPGEPALIAADVGRLRDELGFTPSRSLEAGLAETLQWWQGR